MAAVMPETDNRNGQDRRDDADGDPCAAPARMIAIITRTGAAGLSSAGRIVCRLEGGYGARVGFEESVSRRQARFQVALREETVQSGL